MDILPSRLCLKCGKPLSGRTDKKFCDAYCRNSFNNEHKSDDEHFIQAVNARIRKNRRILKTLCPEGKATVRKEVLDRMGYDFLCFTNIFKSSAGQVYYFAYDFGFAPIYERAIEKALIIRRQDYMDKSSFDIWRKRT